MRIDVRDSIYMSPLVKRDRARLVDLLNEREIYDRTLRIPFPYKRQDADRFLMISSNAESRHGHPVHFAIRDESGELMGVLGFDRVTYGHRAEIGYWLGKPFWGQGIMTDAVRAACRFASDEWKLVRIEGIVFDTNDASSRVLEKSGFHLEGIMVKGIRKEDRFIDCKLFGRTT